MDNTPTREELKAILDEWIPKYIRQVVELRSGSRLSAERYNELMNLLITQGDDTIELAETVKQYVEILVEETETEFEVTTETITNLANNAITTANSAVSTVEEYKTVINQDITAFKETVNQLTATANSNASLALQTANQLVTDMESYRINLSTQIEETFTDIRNTLGAQVTDEVGAQMQGIQEALTADINETISALSDEVRTIVNTAEQSVNAAIQDIEAYKADMDARLDDALREVEESLSAAGDIIRDASAIYAAIDELTELVNGYDERISNLEEFADNADNVYAPKVHSHDDLSGVGHTHTKDEVGLSNVPNVTTNDQTPTFTVASANAELVSGEKLSVAFGKIAKAIKSLISHIADTTSHITSTERSTWNSKANGTHTHTKSQITDFPTSLPASDVYSWAKASAKPSYTWSEITSKPTSFTPASHNQAASTVTAGTLGGKVLANAASVKTLTDKQVRNIYAGTTDMTAGTSTLTAGDIYIVYE